MTPPRYVRRYDEHHHYDESAEYVLRGPNTDSAWDEEHAIEDEHHDISARDTWSGGERL